MADVKIEDLSEDAGLRRLTGDTGVFIGNPGDLEAAKNRYEAQQAYALGKATSEQIQLLEDLDRVMLSVQRTDTIAAMATNVAPAPIRQAPQLPAAPVPSSTGGGLAALKRIRGS